MAEIENNSNPHSDQLPQTSNIFRNLGKSYNDPEQSIQHFNAQSLGMKIFLHDFNNILFGLTNNISFLQEESGNLSLDQRQIIIDIQDGIDRATKLVKNIRTPTKFVPLEKSPTSIRAIINSAVARIFRTSDLNYAVTYINPLPLCPFDKDLINVVLENILVNAMQSMDGSGTISIITAMVKNPLIEQKSHEGEYIKVSIMDQGKGIAPKLQPTIFTPYFTTKEDGHGIGLVRSRQIIEQHNGHLHFSSSENGTTMYFFLPI